MEVETPALQVCPGLEPGLEAFAATLPGEPSHLRLFLQTSPELTMKKLLVAGEPRIFQLCHAFRHEERSDTHHPEFTMLEWYRTGASYEALFEDCAALLRAALEASGSKCFRRRGLECDGTLPCERLSVAEAFARYARIDLFATAPDRVAPSLERLAHAAVSVGIRPGDGDSWEDLFFRIFLDCIEPKLGIGRASLLYDWPISMSALARAKPGDPRVCERVELFVCGLELANGFGELTDPLEQRARFERDRAAKRRHGAEVYPIDEDFLAALAQGMPESAGMALGFDRLVLLACGAERIDDVLWAPVASIEARVAATSHS